MLLYFLTKQRICLSVSSLELMISAAESKYFNVHVKFTFNLLGKKKNMNEVAWDLALQITLGTCLRKLSSNFDVVYIVIHNHSTIHSIIKSQQQQQQCCSIAAVQFTKEKKQQFAYVNKKINKRIASFYNWLWHVVCGIFIGNIFFVKRISSAEFFSDQRLFCIQFEWPKFISLSFGVTKD